MEKVVLIRPDIDKDYPFGKLPAYLPLGLGFIAGVLHAQKYDVRVVDCYLRPLNPDEIIATVRTHDPLFVGISVNISCVQNTNQLSDLLVHSGFYVVLGGPQVTVFPEKTMIESRANVGVIGEGEKTILEIADHLAKNNYNMEDVAGVVFLSGNGIIKSKNRVSIQNLDNLPFIPWVLFPYKEYSKDTSELKRTPLGWMSTSRGCPWNCSFCSNIYVWGRKYRCMSSKRIIDEMLYLKEEIGINAIDFREDNFTVRRERVLDLCRLIKEKNLDIEWKCESRVDIVDNELLREMRGAGCSAIYFGIESGTQRVLDFLNKGFTLGQASNAIRLCRNNRIKTIASVMLGVPTQTMGENLETIDFLKQLKPDMVYFHAFIGIPGSKTYEYIVEQNLIYKKVGDIILANSEFLSWPEKLILKQKAEIMYNLSLRVFFGHLKRMGLLRFIKKVLITLKRYIRSRKSIS